MILNDVIATARRLLQDTDTSLQRHSDADLLDFGNDTLKRICLLRPDLFSTQGNVACTTNEVLQSAPTDSVRLFEVLRIDGGAAVRETNREILDQTHPTWQADTAAAASSWMRHPRNPNQFMIYPQAPVSQTLVVEYAQSPPTYDGVTAVALLSDAYFSVVVDGIVWLCESMDNESVTTQRAQMFQQSFVQSLQASLESRHVTDSEMGGLKEKDFR
ncbi:DUF6682 family protein [uncultured Paraglaciecola sp.]|uniref:phage adaptor protein n=1 Tax=uncultured Paraglaciecola sp. TaxID=1765024 RepID=UPI00345BD99A